jgi:hypothetical protein
LQPYLAETIGAKEALEKAELPIHQFMLAQTRVKDLNTFMEIANVQVRPADVPLRVLIPAFVTSELKTAFQIGFMLFLPFLVIDLVVASILMAMGMMMLSPCWSSLDAVRHGGWLEPHSGLPGHQLRAGLGWLGRADLPPALPFTRGGREASLLSKEEVRKDAALGKPSQGASNES